jgi:integrase
MLPRWPLVAVLLPGDYMKLTKETIERLPLERDKGKPDVIYWDDDLRGFGLRIRGARRSFVCQYRVDHAQRRKSWDAQAVDVTAARKEAKRILAEVELGRDPQGEQIEARARARLTLGTIADEYLEVRRPALRRSSYLANRRYLTQHWRPLRNTPIHKVERRDVAAQLGKISKGHGLIAASRARATLSAFFAWAIREGVADQNPVTGTNEPAADIRARDRVLDESEIRAIWNSCRDDPYGRIIKLLFLTGARREEIGGLRWSELDLETGKLTIPGSRTKNHHELVLTLPELAKSILRDTPRREGDFLFGDRAAFCAWSYSTAVLARRIAERAGSIMPWRLHDIRRSVATHMGEVGIQPHIIEGVLNHRGGHKAGVAGIYNRASYEREIKSALAIWADHLLAIVEGGAPVVVPLRPAG